MVEAHVTFRCLIPVLVVGLLAATSRAVEVRSNLLAKLAPVAPFPALQSAAAGDGIPVTGFDGPTTTNLLSPGDSATCLVTLFQKKNRRTQWLIQINVVTDTNSAARKPSPPFLMYTSTGRKFSFKSTKAAMTTRIVGPFVDEAEHQKPQDKTAQVSVNADFLGLGIDQGTALVYRLHQEASHDPANERWTLSIGGGPFDQRVVAAEVKKAERYHVTEEQERSVAGMIPAFFSYFETVQNTPDLEGIMLKVVKMPSAWSIVRNLGVAANFICDPEALGPASVTGWNYPGSPPMYEQPWKLELNNQPALRLTFLVTAPHSPLLVCGGIVGMLAENPEDPENYLTLRIISARRAATDSMAAIKSKP